jgi:hypothetical protein
MTPATGYFTAAVGLIALIALVVTDAAPTAVYLILAAAVPLAAFAGFAKSRRLLEASSADQEANRRVLLARIGAGMAIAVSAFSALALDEPAVWLPLCGLAVLLEIFLLTRRGRRLVSGVVRAERAASDRRS